MNTISNFKQSLDDFCQLPASGFNQGVTGSSTGTHVDIYLFGIIGTRKINPSTVLQAINKDGTPATVRAFINTVGGSFESGLAIHNTLKQHPAHVTTVNMGYALSMGSLLLLAGDEIEAADNSLLMIHRSQGFSLGDVDDHAKAIEVQKQHDQTLVTTYRKRLNLSDDAIMKLMKAETWYTATEAKAAGLIDTITGAATLDKAGAESGASDLVLAKFRNAPPAFSMSRHLYS